MITSGSYIELKFQSFTADLLQRIYKFRI